MFKGCLLYCVMVFIINSYKIQTTEGKVSSASPDDYPFHAVVYEPKKNRLCSGILVNEDYVLVRASCVKSYENVTVFLGFRRKPTYPSNRIAKGIQKIPGEEIIVNDHDDKPKMSSKDVALVKLKFPAELNATVQPAEFGSVEDLEQLYKRKLIVTGFHRKKNTDMKLSRVQIQDPDVCKTFFGPKFLPQEEICVKWQDKNILDAPGNVLSFNGKVLGLSVPTPECVRKTPNCFRSSIFLNLLILQEWIGRSSNKLTSSNQEAEEVTPKKSAPAVKYMLRTFIWEIFTSSSFNTRKLTK